MVEEVIGDLVAASEPSPGYLRGKGAGVGYAPRSGTTYRRGNSCWGAIGDSRPGVKEVYLDGGIGRSRGSFPSIDLDADRLLYRLISSDGQPPNGYGRIPTVSLSGLSPAH